MGNIRSKILITKKNKNGQVKPLISRLRKVNLKSLRVSCASGVWVI